MKQWRIANLIAFLCIIFATVGLIYVLGSLNFSNPFGKPWHLQSSVHEDSLSTEYKNSYEILDSKPLKSTYFDASKQNVFILVDAWGVPLQESELKMDFNSFEMVPHHFALHRRLANFTRHAEHVEFRDKYDNNVFLFDGDSTQHGRSEYIPTLGFREMAYCHKCGNDSMIGIIDSLLNVLDNQIEIRDSIRFGLPHFIAWTVEASSVGNHDKIRQVLSKIAELAKRHPDVRFVIQGTHRPILCDYKIKGMYKSHWVPVAILN